MLKTNKSAKIIGGVILVALIVAPWGYIYATKDDNKDLISKSDVKSRVEDQKIPEGTVSPHAISIAPQKYLDKEVKIRGLVVETAPGQYSAVSQDTNEPLGLKLDFSKSGVDVSKYANTSIKPDTQTSTKEVKVKDPVTIVGKLSQSKADGNNVTFTLIVKSVQ